MTGLMEERGVCAVAVDRPGYGATDPLDDLDRVGRTQDAVAVAGHLGMARFVVQGMSAGGQYALACAVLVPGQVQAVILTAAGGRITAKDDLDGMAEEFAAGWRQEWRDPEGARAQFDVELAELRADPLVWLRQLTSTWPAEERDWLEKNGQALAEDMMEATRQGAVGYWLDGQATGRPWPFDVGEIQAPIHIFHGDSDTMAPLPILRRTMAPPHTSMKSASTPAACTSLPG